MSLARLRHAVAAGMGEQGLQQIIRRDLGLLGQAVAPSPINDEYIAFAELPVGSGFVDFAVFASRSRMAVTLFEVKGANFKLVTTDGRISAPANHAVQQIRQRFAAIAAGYDPFRRQMHHFRQVALAGDGALTYSVGAAGLPHVDPDKDVVFSGVVIAGRMRETLSDSHVRNAFEQDSPRIRLHSWESWLERQP